MGAQPAEQLVHLLGFPEAEGESVPPHRLDVAGTAVNPVVDEVPLGESRFDGDDAEVHFGDQQSQHPVAQGGELGDVVVVLPDGHHPCVADQFGEAAEGVSQRQQADGFR